MVRLRQVALCTKDLDPVVAGLCERYGLAVAYRDPAVAVFGLVNAVMPIGDQFLEVVAPTREGTAAGRQMERMGGDGGYMVICQVPSLEEQAAVRQRAASLQVREAFAHQEGRSSICQFHPGDTGGSFLEVDCDTTDNGWSPAGPDWPSFVRTDVVTGITGVRVGSPTPDLTASTWAAVLGIPVSDRTIQLDDAVTIAFIEDPVHALRQVTLRGRADPMRIGGVELVTG